MTPSPAIINADRLRARLLELGQIGRTAEDGVTRLSYRAEHEAATQLTARWMNEAGGEVGVDAWGNLFGVVAAVEAAATLREMRIALRHPLLLLAFAEEEGVSFGLGCLGSRGVVRRAPALASPADRGGRSAAGMIFVPSVAGGSHSPREKTAWDDAARGAQLLLRALQRLDVRDEGQPAQRR